MVPRSLFSFLVVLWLPSSSLGADNYNLNRTRIVKNLATKTPYAFVLDGITPAEEFVDESCQPKQLWLLMRHGTRYPSNSGLDAIRFRLPELIEEVKGNHAAGRGHLVAEDLEYLSNWVTDLVKTVNEVPNLTEKFLHPEGHLENTLIAERFREKFPDLLPQIYDPDSFLFRATLTERAATSQFYFATGLFDRKVAQTEVRFDDPVEPHDPLIRFYKTCPKWIREVKKSPVSLAEQRTFETSELFNSRLVSRLSDRLGFKRDLTLAEIETIFVSCVFSQAWQPSRGSAICQILDDDDVQILEYREDLEYFWQDGYGFDINSRPGCVLMKDVFENFEQVVVGQAKKKGIFYFTHSGTVLKFLAFLGLYRDDLPLTSENFDAMKDNRHWRTSLIDAFASNVAFVVKECRSSVDDKVQHRVGLLHNERLIKIPDCSDLWCEFDEFRRIFEDRISNCDPEMICTTSVTSDTAASDTADDRF